MLQMKPLVFILYLLPIGYCYRCEWSYQLPYNNSITEIVYEDYQDSKEMAVKIISNSKESEIVTPLLSSMYVTRNRFKKIINLDLYRCRTKPYDNPSDCIDDSTFLQYLDISKHSFQKIQSNTFANIGKCLQYLILQNNNVLEIHENAFNALPDLKYLDLSQNHINQFGHSTNLLEKLNLHFLNLSSNRLESIHYFNKSLSRIEIVDLSYNQLKMIRIQGTNESLKHENSHQESKYWWNSQTLTSENNEIKYQTKHLNLSNNQIRSFKIENFNEIITLNLASNHIQSLTNSIINSKNLKNLNLSSNHLKYFDLTETTSIEYLDLSSNLIQYLNKNVLKNLQNLTMLNLSNNKIIIKSQSFTFLTNLNLLNLNFNKIQQIPVHSFCGLMNLKELYLSNNELKTFQYGSFMGMENLKLLDLTNNLLNDSLIFDHLMDLDNLTQLILDGNQCTHLDFKDLQFKLKNLHAIGLANMSWTCEQLVQNKIELRKLNITLIKHERPCSMRNINQVNGITCNTGYPIIEKTVKEEELENTIIDNKEAESTDMHEYIETFNDTINKENQPIVDSCCILHRFDQVVLNKSTDVKNILEAIQNLSSLILTNIINLEKDQNTNCNNSIITAHNSTSTLNLFKQLIQIAESTIDPDDSYENID